MKRRPANLAPVSIDGLGPEGEDTSTTPGQSSGGAIRSGPRRSARRKSPYGKAAQFANIAKAAAAVPPGPSSNGLSEALAGSLALDSSRRRRASFQNGSSGGKGTSGPLERQAKKEAAWKDKFAREQASWWDVAAIGVDAAAASQSDAFKSLDSAVLSLRKSESGLLTLAKARNHARSDVKSIEAWRDAAVDSFLGNTPAPQPPSNTLEPTSSLPQHSPGHFGNRRMERFELPCPHPPPNAPLPDARARVRTPQLLQLPPQKPGVHSDNRTPSGRSQVWLARHSASATAQVWPGDVGID